MILEQPGDQRLDGALLGIGALDERAIAMRAAFLGMPDMALGFERAEVGQHGGVGELVVELRLHVSDGGRAVVPQHFHQLGFAFGQDDPQWGTFY